LLTLLVYILACCSQSCQNGGSCDRPNSCICNSGWSGSRCQNGKFNLLT